MIVSEDEAMKKVFVEKEEQHAETNAEIIEKWNGGGICWSVELGGLGPGYEQCIQMLLFEILTKWGDKPMPKDDGENYPKEYEDLANETASTMDKELGFSGARVGAAKATAYQFIKYGYAAQMAKAPKDRLIQVSKNFPGYSSPTGKQ
jgi:hypothetical protein